MNESILNTIKKMIGIEEDYDAYDVDIIVSINAAFGSLTQIGIGPDTGFTISDATTTWGEYVSDINVLNLLKQYMYLKVKNVFDPAASSAVSASYENVVKELEWRLNLEHEKGLQSQ